MTDTVTTTNLIYIGNFASTDEHEGDFDSERAASVLNGVSVDHSQLQVLSTTIQDRDHDGVVADDECNPYHDTLTYNTGTGTITNETDSTMVGSVTLTLSDGSTKTLDVVMMQQTNGDLFISDLLNCGTLDNLSISAVHINSVTTTNSSGWFTNQSVDNTVITAPVIASDGIVAGTSGNDDIDLHYNDDPDGDRIDNNDAILAGEGPQDDIVMAGAGDDKVEAGLGDDEVYGGTGKDELKGETGNDALYGGDGDDKLFGGDGNDLLDGGAGNDGYLKGEAGDDTIFGGDGEDKAEGGVGDDTIYGGADDDELKGENGNDVLFGGDGIDKIDGGDGNDYIDGGAGDDYRLAGGEGDDTIIGGEGNDKIEGGKGDDIIDGGAGADEMKGDYDRDMFINVTAGDKIDGGSGGYDFDTLDLSGAGPLEIEYTSSDKEDGIIKFLDSNGQVTGTAEFKEIENIILPDPADGTVTGTAGNDLIDLNYLGDPDGDLVDNNDAIVGNAGSNDDIIEALGGDDTVLAGAGNDTVYAGTGDDTVDGGTGDDIIFGDTGTSIAGGTVRESFEWDLQTENQVDTTFVQDTGEVSVTFTRTADDGHHDSKLNTEHLNVDGIDDGAETIDTDSGLFSVTGGQAGRGEFQWAFSAPVSNVDFNINDIDGDGVVKVTAYDADGNEIPVQLDGGDKLTLIDTDGVNGADTADSKGGYEDTTSDNYNLQVTIPGPVAKIVVEHTQDGSNNSGVVITDMYYDAPIGGVGAAVGGDDVITGGAGSDEMYGEDGNDTFVVGSGSDADGDIIFGGNGPDDTTDLDVLDLTGAGKVTINDTADANDDGATKGTVTFEDGSVLTFEGIEQIITDPQNEAPTAVDDVVDVDEDDQVTFNPTLNDTDPDGDTLTVVSISDPANGALVDNGDGTFTYVPDANFNGTDTVTYTVEDPSGAQSTATVTFNVARVNDAPIALDDSDTTDFNTSVTVDLLANDSDVDGDLLTVVDATVPAAQGTLVDNGDGTVTFTPVLGFTGTATISYTISDGELEDSAVHKILVGDAPLDGTVEGTAGNDIIDGGYLGDPDGDRVDNNDAILPGDVGNDDLIFGFEGNDTILAGQGDDEVYGGVGDDSILGQGGFDTLFGDEGNDTITGGRDNDTIIGGADEDVLDGDSGDDSIEGSGGDDSILGGGGDDILRGGTGNDTIDGENNNDTIFGGAGDDDLSGGNSDDSITGGSGNDVIDGGAGDDNVLSGSGDDVVDGGTGHDTLITGDGSDVVEGGDGNDTIDTSGHAPLPDLGFGNLIPADGITITLPDGTVVTTSPDDDKDTVFGGAGNDTITTGDDSDFIDGGTGDDFIDGGIDADEILGGDGNDTIVGGEGSDSISGGEGNDTIFAGIQPGQTVLPDIPGAPFIPEQIKDAVDPEPDNGDDLVFGGAGNDTIFGADDSDELYGDEGDDVLNGEIDDDTLFGGDGDDVLTGGEGADEQYGGFGDDSFIVDQEGNGAGDVVVGGEDPDDGDVDVLDLTGSNVDFITYVDGDDEAGTVTFLDGSTMTFSEIENVIPCFTPGTTIATPKGERLVEELRIGDRIITRDNGIQEIRWVGRKDMSGKSLVSNAHLKPILVRAGALGNGLPERDMLVSPNHRVLVASDKTQLYFEEREVLAAAKHLVGSEGIHAIDVMGTSYIHFMFDRHEVVLSNGAWTESFQPGDYSLKGIGNSQRNEIFELFPELQERQGLESYQSARRALKKHEAKLLIK